MTIRAVDLFAGCGGTTEGAHQAGVRVVWAANHWPAAVDWHRTNHPRTSHSCQDLRQADFTRLPPFELLLASPACQGHSPASQSRRRAKHDADRSTAWAVVDCVDTCRPRMLIVENVPRFRAWQLYPVWRQALEVLGYRLEEHLIDAADYDTPQNRRRLFIAGWLAKRPRSLHLPPPCAHVPAEAILDAHAGGWVSVKSKSLDIQGRIARGVHNFGPRFLTQHVTGHPGRPLSRPIGTITTVGGHWHLVDSGRVRSLTVRELARAQAFRDSFQLPEDSPTLATKLVGNAVPPRLAEVIIRSMLDAA